MPVAVRNTKTGPTVFSIPEDKIEIEWQGAGDPEGRDIQEVPDAVLQDTRFRRAIAKGVLARVSDEEARAALDHQIQSAHDREAAAAAQAVSTIDQAANNDLVSLPCQGPGGRGTGECGTPVPVRESKKGDAPVLCPQHEGLVGEFAQVQTGQMIDKGATLEPETVWVRSVMGRREHQTSATTTEV